MTYSCTDFTNIKRAVTHARDAVELLRAAQANNAAGYVSRAVKSIEGARRHAEGMLAREQQAS